MMSQFDIDPLGNKSKEEALQALGIAVYFLTDTLSRAMAVSAVAHAYGASILLVWWIVFILLDLVTKKVRVTSLKERGLANDEDDDDAVRARAPVASLALAPSVL